MSEFLLVIPEGWTQISMDAATQIPGVSAGGINSWIGSNYFDIMTSELSSLFPPGAVVLEAQVFNGETLLVRLG
jgi:hypothetical protein